MVLAAAVVSLSFSMPAVVYLDLHEAMARIRALSGGDPMPVQQHPSGHENPKVAAVILVLHNWYLALENHTAPSIFPDPAYERRDGKPPWTDAEVDRVLDTIDYELQHEMSQRPTYWAERGWHVPPEFKAHLEMPQRRALVQQLDNALRTSSLKPMSPP